MPSTPGRSTCLSVTTRFLRERNSSQRLCVDEVRLASIHRFHPAGDLR
jgi:hypothetical protein